MPYSSSQLARIEAARGWGGMVQLGPEVHVFIPALRRQAGRSDLEAILILGQSALHSETL